MSPTVIQEIETRRPNTSSQNITGKEIKNLSKFFVLNLELKIKPKHLRGPGGTLRLKCTAEESCFSWDYFLISLICNLGPGSLLEECRGLPDGGEILSPSSSLVLSSVRHLRRVCRSWNPQNHHFYFFYCENLEFSKLKTNYMYSCLYLYLYLFIFIYI